jgi:hypothetical protein
VQEKVEDACSCRQNIGAEARRALASGQNCTLTNLEFNVYVCAHFVLIIYHLSKVVIIVKGGFNELDFAILHPMQKRKPKGAVFSTLIMNEYWTQRG